MIKLCRNIFFIRLKCLNISRGRRIRRGEGEEGRGLGKGRRKGQRIMIIGIKTTTIKKLMIIILIVKMQKQ